MCHQVRRFYYVLFVLEFDKLIVTLDTGNVMEKLTVKMEVMRRDVKL